MRLLLDECVPRRLQRAIPGHDVRTVHDERWLGLRDGAILRRAEGLYDAVVTVDQNLPYQHPIARYSFGIVVLQARHNRYGDLLPLIPQLLELLPKLRPGTSVAISEPTTQ